MTVQDLMTPIPERYIFSSSCTPKSALDQMFQDDIGIAVINANGSPGKVVTRKNLCIHKNDQITLGEIAEEPMRFTFTHPAASALRQMKEHHEFFALIDDEHGLPCGLFIARDVLMRIV